MEKRGSFTNNVGFLSLVALVGVVIIVGVSMSDFSQTGFAYFTPSGSIDNFFETLQLPGEATSYSMVIGATEDIPSATVISGTYGVGDPKLDTQVSVNGTDPEELDKSSVIGGSEHGEFPKWKDFKQSFIAECEKRYLKDLMSRTNTDVKEASKMSGLSQPRLYELLRKHQLATR